LTLDFAPRRGDIAPEKLTDGGARKAALFVPGS
jgi:hypothetical protein